MRRNHYETAVIINAALDDEQIEAELVKISGIITDGGGVISETEKWGRKRLAYTINKNRIGYYVIYRFEAPVDLIAEFERLLKIDEAVVRFLTIRLEKEALEYFANKKTEAEAAELEAVEFEVVADDEADVIETEADEAEVEVEAEPVAVVEEPAVKVTETVAEPVAETPVIEAAEEVVAEKTDDTDEQSK